MWKCRNIYLTMNRKDWRENKPRKIAWENDIKAVPQIDYETIIINNHGGYFMGDEIFNGAGRHVAEILEVRPDRSIQIAYQPGPLMDNNILTLDAGMNVAISVPSYGTAEGIKNGWIEESRAQAPQRTYRDFLATRREGRETGQGLYAEVGNNVEDYVNGLENLAERNGTTVSDAVDALDFSFAETHLPCSVCGHRPQNGNDLCDHLRDSRLPTFPVSAPQELAVGAPYFTQEGFRLGTIAHINANGSIRVITTGEFLGAGMYEISSENIADQNVARNNPPRREQ